jgi:hypothetical protein
MRALGLIQRAALAAIVTVGTASCGDVVRDGRSPSFLVIDSISSEDGTILLSDVVNEDDTTGNTIFNDVATATLRLAPKNVIPGDLGPTSNNDVTVFRYRVSFRRADGRNTQGVDVPYAFDGASTVTIRSGGTASVPFEIVRHAAKTEAPLAQLVNSPTIITTIAEITFYGRDLVGNDISASGLIQVNFGNFADDED